MRTKKTVVILVSGKAGSGKDTVAKFVRDKLMSVDADLKVAKYSLAAPIKYIAQAFFGWNSEKDNAGRKLLQDLGKVGRDYDEHVWIKHMYNQLSKYPYPPHFVVVSDWRFPNERDYIKSNPLFELYTVRVSGRETSIKDMELAKDVSEISLNDDDSYDAVIYNVSDLVALEKHVDILVSAIQDKYIVV